MKYININFDNWVDISMSTNEQQIKELHPIFYQFLIEKKLMDIYLEMFDKCHWKYKGDTFEEIISYYRIKKNFLLNPIDYTLNYKCVNNYNIKYYNIIIDLDLEFKFFLRTTNFK